MIIASSTNTKVGSPLKTIATRMSSFLSRSPWALLAALGLVPLLLVLSQGQAQAQAVVAIEIQGNRNVRTDAIMQHITQTKIGEPVSEAKLAADGHAVAEMGYFEPGVAPGDPQSQVYAYAQSVEGGVKVIFKVHEYPLVEAIVLSGNTLVPSEDLMSKMTLRPATVFNPSILNNDMERIKNEYRSRGYLVDIEDIRRLKGIINPDQVVLSVILVEGWVEKIEIVGLRRTKGKTVRDNIIDTVVGQKFDEAKLLADRRRLLNLQVFEGQQGVNVRRTFGSKLGAYVVVFDLQESRTGLLNAGVGYNSRDRVVGTIEATENNLFGLAHRANVKVEFGGVSSYELGYYSPRIDRRRTALSGSVYNKWINRFVSPELSASGGFASTRNERRQGLTLTATRPLNRRETSSVWATFTTENVSGRFLDSTTSILESFYARGQVNSVTLKGLQDNSDYSVDPTRGWRNSLSLEQAGAIFGGQRDYTKFTFDLRHYAPAKNNVLAVRAIYGVSIGDLPLFDAFIAGGSETLRGYAEDRFWGRKTLLLNLEYRIPVSGKQERKVQVVPFLDLGDAFGGVWRTPDNSVVYPAEHQHFSPHWGYGVGLRFNVGVGFMRLDFGFSQEGDQPHFSFGHMF